MWFINPIWNIEWFISCFKHPMSGLSAHNKHSIPSPFSLLVTIISLREIPFPQLITYYSFAHDIHQEEVQPHIAVNSPFYHFPMCLFIFFLDSCSSFTHCLHHKINLMQVPTNPTWVHISSHYQIKDLWSHTSGHYIITLQ